MIISDTASTNRRSLFDLHGLRAFVAGGYGVIGRATAACLVDAGAAVAIAGRSGASAASLARELSGDGSVAHGFEMDARDVASIGAAVDAAAARLGGLDTLVNCIGFNSEQRVGEVSETMFDEIYRVNLRAAMFLAQSVAAHQIAAARGGSQIHLLSVRARLGMRGYGYSAYCANKGALVMLIKQHAVELAEHRITVNGIAPTVVDSPMASEWRSDRKRWEALLARIPLGRVAEASDVAAAALFFCAPASRFITGQVLYLDGGITATQ